jgi:hypothetical protein
LRPIYSYELIIRYTLENEPTCKLSNISSERRLITEALDLLTNNALYKPSPSGYQKVLEDRDDQYFYKIEIEDGELDNE